MELTVVYPSTLPSCRSVGTSFCKVSHTLTLKKQMERAHEQQISEESTRRSQCNRSPKRITTKQLQAVTQSNSAPYIQRWLQLPKQDFEHLKLWKRILSFVFFCAPTFSNQSLQHKCWPAQDFCPWPWHCHWMPGQGGHSSIMLGEHL